MEAKTIGIDARFYGKAGPGRYTKNLVKHLEKVDKVNKYKVFVTKEGFEDYTPENPNFEKHIADYKVYSFGEQIGFLLKALGAKLDLFYVPHFNIPILYPGKLVTAIPDIIMHSFSTEAGTTLPKPYFKLKKIVYKFVVWWAVIRSKRVIVPSQATLDDFLKAFPKISKDKYIIATEGISPGVTEHVGKITEEKSREVLNEFGIKKPFLLYVSSMYEHKNVPNLIDALLLLKTKHQFDGQLVLVGKKDKFSERIHEKVQKERLEDVIKMPGIQRFITDEEIASLRTTASLYVFPSLKEGFSLTPLEAMYYDLPCVLSNIPCHTEIYGSSAEYFDPNSVENMAETINMVLTDNELQKRLIEEGKKLTKKYDWTHTAQVTLDEFNKAFE